MRWTPLVSLILLHSMWTPVHAVDPREVQEAVRQTTLRAPVENSYYQPPPAFSGGTTTREADTMARQSHLWKRLQGEEKAVEGRVAGNLRRYTIRLGKAAEKENTDPIFVKPRNPREDALQANRGKVDVDARDRRPDPSMFIRVPIQPKTRRFSPEYEQSGRDAQKMAGSRPGQLPGETLEEYQKRIGRAVKREARKPTPFYEDRFDLNNFSNNAN